MRQLFFAIVLVGVAFVGGAMVNGPGFRWAQDHFFDYMGLKDGGEIASIDLPPAPGDADADADASPAPSQPRTGASASKDGPAAADRSPRKPDATPAAKRKSLAEIFGGAKPATPAETKPPEPVAPQLASKSDPAASPTPPLMAGPSGAPGPEPSAPPAPLDPGVAPALLASLSPAPSNPPPASPPAADVETKEAPGSASMSAAAASAAAGGGGDWADLRRKLKAQGVTRYTIEVDTGGRVVFSCLIPLAGKQAVSQRFEAEGDDEFAAAKAALRRINLWRATRTPAPASS